MAAPMEPPMEPPKVPEAASDQALHSPLLWGLAVGSLLALVVLCVAWEWLLAPLRPGGSWMIVKALPALLPLRGVITRNRYTMQWSSMLILLFFTEGVVRATSEPGPAVPLAWAEVALSLLYFFAIILYLRPYKRRAVAARKAAQTATQTATQEAEQKAAGLPR